MKVIFNPFAVKQNLLQFSEHYLSTQINNKKSLKPNIFIFLFYICRPKRGRIWPIATTKKNAKIANSLLVRILLPSPTPFID